MINTGAYFLTPLWVKGHQEEMQAFWEVAENKEPMRGHLVLTGEAPTSLRFPDLKPVDCASSFCPFELVVRHGPIKIVFIKIVLIGNGIPS